MNKQEQQQRETIISLTEQCALLIKERDTLLKKLQQYEKFGVTCQTYRHKLNFTGCGECNTGK